MAGTFVVNGDWTITVAFTYTALASKVTDTVGDAVACIYPQTYAEPLEVDGVAPPLEALSNQQKLNMLDAWQKKGVLDLAKQFHTRDAVRVAREDASAEAAERYF